jgi:hypothetical protein
MGTGRLCAATVLGVVLIIIGHHTCLAGEADASERKLRQDCLPCHKRETPGIYHQWKAGEHAEGNVSCYDCHRAKKGEVDAFEHEGATIAALVTPKDCGRCHKKEAKEFQASHHAKAGRILDSLDNYLAGVAVGYPAVLTGCESCHGNTVRIDPKSPNKLAKLSYPNSGIGRINPDGSSGACNACHLRHSFSKSQARRPEHCGKCHMGPDHPQKEVYEESKHGISYRANSEKMNLEKDSWIVGVDYSASPTCATCHMSATRKQKVSHDIGKRISWTLRPIVSKGQPRARERREAMTDVCQACHGRRHVDGFYASFDGLVNLYNDKFAKPSLEIMKILRKNGSLKGTDGRKSKAGFGSKVEWTFWELWHHEGRRARHGASMMGPDYAWWHGMYEVSKHFYFKFIPEVRELGDAEANAYIDKVLAEPIHAWLSEDKAATAAKLRSGATAKMYEGLFDPPWISAPHDGSGAPAKKKP